MNDNDKTGVNSALHELSEMEQALLDTKGVRPLTFGQARLLKRIHDFKQDIYQEYF